MGRKTAPLYRAFNFSQFIGHLEAVLVCARQGVANQQEGRYSIRAVIDHDIPRPDHGNLDCPLSYIIETSGEKDSRGRSKIALTITQSDPPFGYMCVNGSYFNEAAAKHLGIRILPEATRARRGARKYTYIIA